MDNLINNKMDWTYMFVITIVRIKYCIKLKHHMTTR